MSSYRMGGRGRVWPRKEGKDKARGERVLTGSMPFNKAETGQFRWSISFSLRKFTLNNQIPFKEGGILNET